jgi:hypothetical protein
MVSDQQRPSEPVALCTVVIQGRPLTVWLTDASGDEALLPLSARREKLAELIRQGEIAGVAPEYLSADREILQALDRYLSEHGDLLATPAIDPVRPARSP